MSEFLENPQLLLDKAATDMMARFKLSPRGEHIFTTSSGEPMWLRFDRNGFTDVITEVTDTTGMQRTILNVHKDEGEFFLCAAQLPCLVNQTAPYDNGAVERIKTYATKPLDAEDAALIQDIFSATTSYMGRPNEINKSLITQTERPHSSSKILMHAKRAGSIALQAMGAYNPYFMHLPPMPPR